MNTMTHPRTGDTIADIHDTVAGYRGTFTEKATGKQVTVEGTWALGTPLSWVKRDEKPIREGQFQTGTYIVVCGSWQY